MIKNTLRRTIYGIVTWVIIFTISNVIVEEVSDSYLFIIPIIMPFVIFALSLRCLRKKPPGWGSEGLKAGATWILTAAVLDLVVLPHTWEGLYGAYLSSNFLYVTYAELLIVPWFADKLMTGLRKI